MMFTRRVFGLIEGYYFKKCVEGFNEKDSGTRFSRAYLPGSENPPQLEASTSAIAWVSWANST
jgi:hypothetical protein